MGKSFINYIKECYTELMTKVSWPSWSDLQSHTVVVLVATVIIALFVFLFDTLFSHLMKDVIYSLFN